MEGKNKQRVIELIKNNPQGLTIQEIADKLVLSRITVSIVLAELKGEHLIEIREVGQAKLHYWKKGGEENGKWKNN